MSPRLGVTYKHRTCVDSVAVWIAIGAARSTRGSARQAESYAWTVSSRKIGVVARPP